MRLLFVLTFVFILNGCASYQNRVAPAKAYLKNKNCREAIINIEKLSEPTGSDQLALLMEHGTTLQVCEQYDKSNQVLTQAENLADSIDYTSVTQVANATLLNEGMVSYKGDTFEKLFLNASKALNYLQLDKNDDALVEVRKMNQKFAKFKNEERKNFELNSFSKYLSGVIWESTGQYDDACIDYKDAYFASENPGLFRQIGQQMLTTCWQADRKDEFNSLVKKMSATSEEIETAKKSKRGSEIIFIFLQGWGPQKQPNPSSPTFPQLVSVTNRTQGLIVELFKPDSTVAMGNYKSSAVYSVADAARASLNADQASLIARRLASRVTKHVVADQIRQKNELLGLAALVVMVGSEQADLRQWSFLPNGIQVIRIPVAPGKYKAKINGVDLSGVPSEEFADVEINVDRKQKKTYMVRSLL